MLINGAGINGEAINGPGHIPTSGPIVASGIAVEFEQSVVAVAAGTAVEVEQSVGAVASGTAVEFEQLVGILASGIAVEFEQSVVFSAVGSGIAVEFEQVVQAVAAGIAVEFEQRVRDTNASASHLDLFGWDARITINGKLVPLCEIGGEITVTRNENASALAQVTLVNKTGQQDFDAWHGKQILIDADTDTGTRRIFTGTIDYPRTDLVNKTIRLDCIDRREERVNAQLSSQVKFVGFWSPDIFETPEDTAEELRQRLETTPHALDFDSYGQHRVTSLLAKSTPDFTLERCDISNDIPVLNLSTRSRLVNRVRMEFEARWTRLRHREKSFKIEAPAFCDYMTVQGLDYLRIDSVYQTLDSFPWAVKPSTIDFTYLPDAGVYNCGNGKFIWTPPRGFGSVKVVRDQNGDIVYDASGNPVYEPVAGSSAAPIFCLSANWTAAKRWAQDISESITVTLNAPQSIGQYGAIERTNRYGYDVEYDTQDYESNETYQSPSGFISAGNGDYYLDKSGSAVDYKKALQTGFSICEATIVKSHRENTVAFRSRNFWPDVELYHTVAINTDTITCRGKVKQIVHKLNTKSKRATTNVVLALSRAQGGQSQDSLSFPILDAPLVGNPGSNVTYKLYQGQGGGSGGGLLGQGTSYATPPVKNSTLKAPDIDEMSRKQQKTSDSYSYNVVLQNDPLDVNF
ncbi:hypothetical protein [Methylophaga sp. OBS4]|uniref:hypothetical protein n=1 Tax=Methylophaga sp. OBS4 TaxID=2991935 RepID=UPI00224F685D|nr:hypothetical protein [Methylophaga sp. OBS4]MCX4186778.1 hypothetical protein [Methylophaga sp. OBS4]